ncbi:MAG: hypothetical protein WCV63_05265 [Negativicutes bacterium]|jgi:predicted protein tyrosine phosphatase
MKKRMRKIFYCLIMTIVLFGASGALAAGNGVFMVFDTNFSDALANYRSSDMMSDALNSKQAQMNPDNAISTKGLTDLHISGSAPFDRTQLSKLVQNTAGYKLYVVDLRQEAHAYLNSAPITWYADNDWINKGLTDKQAAESDKKRIDWLATQGNVTIYTDKKQSRALHVEVISATDEEAFVRSFQVAYKRFFVSDHMAPNNDTIDAFVKFCDALPKNSWLHFHCRGGDGRTTTFMVLYDALKNADKVSLYDIIERQAAVPPNYNILTKADLGAVDDNEARPAVEALFKERSAAVKKFYNFARARLTTGYKGSWIEWVSEK